MLLLNLLILFGISFCGFSFVVALQKWRKARKYQYQIKGTIHNVTIEANKVFFIVKWYTPNNLRDDNPQDQLNSGVQYYHHVVQQCPQFQNDTEQTEFVAKLMAKYLDKNFYLHAHENNGVIREVVPYTSGGSGIVWHGLLLTIFFSALYYKKSILAWFD